MRLREHLRRCGGQQVAVVLVSLCLPCIFLYQYFPAKDTGSPVVEHCLEELVAGAMRYGMIEEGKVIDVLTAVTNGQPPRIHMGVLSQDTKAVIVACVAVVKGNCTGCDV